MKPRLPESAVRLPVPPDTSGAPPLNAQDLVPHLRELAKALRERGTDPNKNDPGPPA